MIILFQLKIVSIRKNPIQKVLVLFLINLIQLLKKLFILVNSNEDAYYAKNAGVDFYSYRKE